MLKDKSIKFSIIIPLYNEERNINILHKELISISKDYEYEIIYVNDGSTDSTYNNLVGAVETERSNVPIKIINIHKNIGQTLAFKIGLDNSLYDVIVFMDGDLQNNPQDIPILIDEFRKGYDLVQGVRYRRKDPFFTRVLPSLVANFVLRVVCGSKFKDLGCSLKIFYKRNIDEIIFYQGMHRMLPIYYSLKSKKVTEVAVSHRRRVYEKSKYGFSRSFEILFEIVKINFFEKESNFFIYTSCLIGLLLIIMSLLSYFFIILNNFMISLKMMIAVVTLIVGIYSFVISASLYIIRSSYIYQKRLNLLKNNLWDVESFG